MNVFYITLELDVTLDIIRLILRMAFSTKSWRKENINLC